MTGWSHTRVTQPIDFRHNLEARVNVFTMAWRNVWRNHRRSTITIAAMTLALVVELLYAGMVTGMMGGMEDDVTEYELGDVQVFAQGYLTRPSLYDVVDEPDALIAALQDGGYQATSRLYGGGLAGAGEASSGVALVGLDPVRDAEALSLSQALARGTWLDGSDPTGVVVGGGLARTLGLELGSELVVLSQATDGSMASELFTVRGVLLSVAASMDRSTVLVPESTFRELMVLPEGAHRIIVRRPADVPLADAKAFVAGVVEGRDGIEVKTWRELSPFLAQWLDSVSSVVVVFYLIIYVTVGILILNAMLMAVFERIREFGVLKAIGVSPLQVLAMMLCEGLIQASIATGIGVLLALPAMVYLQTTGVDVGALGGVQMIGMTMPAVWMGEFSVATSAVPVVMLYVISLAAVLYPAIKAARVSPVEAMHHQ